MSDRSEDKTTNEESQMRLVDVPVENEPIALNSLSRFLMSHSDWSLFNG